MHRTRVNIPGVRECRRAGQNGAVAVLVLLIVLLVAACGHAVRAPSTTPSPTQTTAVTIAVYPGTVWSVPIYAAQREGFFRQHGISATLVPFSTSPVALASLASGSIDTASASPEVFLAAVASGLNMRVFAGLLKIPWTILLAKSVRSSSSTYPTDLHALAGLTIGVPAIPSAGQAILDVALHQAGLSPSAVHLAAVGIGPSALAALKTGSIQALVTQQPEAEEAVAQAGARILMNPTQNELPKSLSGPYMGQWVLASYAKAHPTTVRNLRAALVEAQAWLSNRAKVAAVAQLLSSIYNAPGLNYTNLAKGDEQLWTAGYSVATLKAYDTYDVEYGFLRAFVPVGKLVWSGA